MKFDIITPNRVELTDNKGRNSQASIVREKDGRHFVYVNGFGWMAKTLDQAKREVCAHLNLNPMHVTNI